ncbi:MAG: LLM class flavin-dependent oxidoreductase, partial [Acidimicrobiales bacterium]
VLTGPVVDPVVGLAWAAAHNPTVKIGTTMLAPGRNPIRLAKQLSTLDFLSGGRLLVTLVPGINRGAERAAIGVPVAARGALIDEVLPLLRRLWAGDCVTYNGPGGRFEDVTLTPLPAQSPLEVWLGGMAPAALERCGRLADGWLPSLCTPDEAAGGRKVVEETAAQAGRTISPEHFGVSIGYAQHPLSAEARRTVAVRSRGTDPDLVVPVGWGALRRSIEDFIDVGFSKFVLRPLVPPQSWVDELHTIAGAIGDLQT